MLKQVIIVRTDLKMGKPYKSKEFLTNELKGKNYKQIALESNISITTVQRYLKKFNLTKYYKDWGENEIKLLKEFYPSQRIKFESLLPNRTHSSIHHKAHRLGLKRLVKPLKYSMNETFFNKWSKEMAYFLGWLYSDGNVSREKRNFNLHINLKDAYILEIFRKCLNSNHPIKFYKNAATLKIYSRLMCEKLGKLGCIPKKSLHINFPNIPNCYLNHFVRGFFDGDGSIHFNKPNTIKISFLGTKQFIETLQYLLNLNLGIKNHKLTYYHKLYKCQYYGDDARKLCFWMYKNSKNLYLKRKRERFSNHIEKRKKLVNGRYK